MPEIHRVGVHTLSTHGIKTIARARTLSGPFDAEGERVQLTNDRSSDHARDPLLTAHLLQDGVCDALTSRLIRIFAIRLARDIGGALLG